MSKKIVAANWKMNNDEYLSKSLAYEFLKLLNHKNNLNTIKILCVPFPFLSTIDNMCQGAGSVFVGAQNCSPYDEGAYTGEVSAKMFADKIEPEIQPEEQPVAQTEPEPEPDKVEA